MRLANFVRLSVFCKEDEDEKQIEEGLRKLLPLDMEKEKINISRQKATGFNEKKILIMEIELRKDRHINSFLESLKANLGSAQKEMLLRQKESRLDTELNFFIRLDKERLHSGEYFVTDSGSCYHIKISIAAFPKTRENALKTLEDIFGNGYN